MRRLTVLAVILFVLASNTPAIAATAFWIEPEMVVEADEAVTPGLPVGEPRDAFEPDDTEAHARELRVGRTPQDHVLSPGDEDWFLLFAADGPGYIRIGADGPFRIETSVEDGLENPGISENEGPSEGADLVETSEWSVTEQAINWEVDHAIMRLTSPSAKPVRYRISFVSELPENRVGSAYGPGVAAEEYVLAIAEGDLTTLYRMSRSHLTTAQVDALREELFGQASVMDDGFTVHVRNRDADMDALGELPVQQIILSAGEPGSTLRKWAFRVECVQKDGLWLVNRIEKDPSLSDGELEAIVERDMYDEAVIMGAFRSAMAGDGLKTLLVELAALLLVYAVIGVFVWRKRLQARR